MKRSTLGVVTFALGLALGGFPAAGGFESLSLVSEAEAVVGRPVTPVSCAGVARRTTRRVIRRTTIYVMTLPAPCTVVVIEGTSLHLCGGTYYQPHGSQYVVVNVD
ncbi:MAG: hypothetical protein MUF10_03270 [Thermoanaerobaculaceae bacterium]|jgi:hypothetical protein|nr:hypothetical protein [Thermoanaerobaculaceae bacterium]